VLDVVQEALFDLLVFRVAALVDVTPRAVLVDHGRQLGNVQQPFFQVGDGVDRPLEQPLADGLDLRPVGGVEVLRYELALRRCDGGGCCDHVRRFLSGCVRDGAARLSRKAAKN
jgi:hypothetical protein